MHTITRYVIHEVHKAAKSSEVAIEYSEKIAIVDDFSKKLIEETHKSFGTSATLKNTVFEEGHSTKFHTSLLKYLNDQTDEEFYSFSTTSLEDLKTRVEKELFATGGYYLFADYMFDDKRYISTILLRKKDGVNLKKIDNVLRPVAGDNLNIEKIAMGFRLNHGLFISNEQEKRYIALVTTQKDVLSGYFKDWVQAGGIIAFEKNTSSLVTIIKSIDIPLDDDGKPKFASRQDMSKAFYTAIEKAGGKVINLHSLSEQFYGNDKRDHIQKYASANQITIDSEFKKALPVLKKLVTVHATVKGIELFIDYDKLNANDVDVKEKLIVIRSKELADQIRQQKNG
jgi:nucleoid-associated protein YejK